MKPSELIKACPIEVKDDYLPYVTSPFGNRIYKGKHRFHHGVDMVVDHKGKHLTGRVVNCFEKAVIVFSGHYGNAGNSIILLDMSSSTRLQRIIACYCHLEEIYDHAGDIVIQSEAIGYMGGTGSTPKQYGAHLHYSINILEKDVSVLKGISGHGARNPFDMGLQNIRFASSPHYDNVV